MEFKSSWIKTQTLANLSYETIYDWVFSLKDEHLYLYLDLPSKRGPTGLLSMTDPQKPTDANTSVTGKVI